MTNKFIYNSIVISGTIIWISTGIFFVLPKKLKLLKKYSFDKTTYFFLYLAKNGNPEAKELVKISKLFIYSGIFYRLITIGFKS